MEFNSLALSFSYYSSSYSSTSYSKASLEEMELVNEVQTKNLIGRLEQREYDENGIDLTLSLRPPEFTSRQCSWCKRIWTPQWRLWQKKTLCNACGLQAKKKKKQPKCRSSLDA